MKSIVQEIEELRRMKVPELVERYQQVFGKEPRIKHREHLWKRVAWKIQEERFGGLSEVAKARLEELIGEIELPLTERQRTVSGKLKKAMKPSDPPVGTTLVRIWRGKEIRAQVVDGGFEVDGTLYRTLSEAAKAITGSHWNGKLFFGLTTRKRAK